MYRSFLRQCVRNLALGTLLSIGPAGVFYWFIFNHGQRQMMILLPLALLDLAIFLPLDILLLKTTLRPVERALAANVTAEERRAGLKRLLDSPWIVLLRVFGPHAVMATIGITLLVMLANRVWALGIEPQTFPLYWALNLTIIPIAHAVYEFAGMERAVQAPSKALAAGMSVQEAGAKSFTLHTRMRIFFPLLALAPVLLVSLALIMHNRNDRENDPDHGGEQHVAGEADHGHASGGEMKHQLLDMAKIGVSCAGLFLYLMWTLGGQLNQQTKELMNVLDRLGKGDLAARAELYTTSEFGQLAQHVNDMATGLGERERLRELFGAYMTPEVAHTLLQRDEAAGRTEKRFVAILFLDVRNFTAFSNEHEPDEVVEVLNRLLTAAVEAVTSAGGTVNKYLGDGLLATFGAPVRLENACASAIEAATQIVARVAKLNAQMAGEGRAAMKIGIGVHAGEVVVGTIGAPQHKLEYTVIGDAVNVASRIEQLTKKLGVPVLVSKDALDQAGPRWAQAAGEPVEEQVKGIEKPVVVVPIRIVAGEARVASSTRPS